MANELPEDSTFADDVQAILTTDTVLGEAPGFSGSLNGKINIVLKTIADRTKWLRDNMMSSVANATTTVRGIIELATQNEARAATDTTRAMTPARTLDLIRHSNAGASETERGTMEIANTSEAEAGTDNVRAMTPQKTTDHYTERRATVSEVNTGTNNTKYVTPDTFHDSDPIQSILPAGSLPVFRHNPIGSNLSYTSEIVGNLAIFKVTVEAADNDVRRNDLYMITSNWIPTNTEYIVFFNQSHSGLDTAEYENGNPSYSVANTYWVLNANSGLQQTDIIYIPAMKVV